MKARLIYVIILCAVTTLITIKSYNSNRTAIMNIALNNIEALAESEDGESGESGEAGGGGGGIRTARCGKTLEPSPDDAFHYKCNPKTDSNTMYKCPGVVSKGAINSFEGHFSCVL